MTILSMLIIGSQLAVGAGALRLNVQQPYLPAVVIDDQVGASAQAGGVESALIQMEIDLPYILSNSYTRNLGFKSAEMLTEIEHWNKIVSFLFLANFGTLLFSWLCHWKSRGGNLSFSILRGATGMVSFLLYLSVMFVYRVYLMYLICDSNPCARDDNKALGSIRLMVYVVSVLMLVDGLLFLSYFCSNDNEHPGPQVPEQNDLEDNFQSAKDGSTS